MTNTINQQIQTKINYDKLKHLLKINNLNLEIISLDKKFLNDNDSLFSDFKKYSDPVSAFNRIESLIYAHYNIQERHTLRSKRKHIILIQNFESLIFHFKNLNSYLQDKSVYGTDVFDSLNVLYSAIQIVNSHSVLTNLGIGLLTNDLALKYLKPIRNHQYNSNTAIGVSSNLTLNEIQNFSSNIFAV